jgi:DHA2 family multidrug resistance protein-like MFS transporter
VALSMAAVVPIIYGIKRLAVPEGGGPALPVAAIVVGAGVGALFVRRQLRLATPLLDLRLFRNPTFTAVLCALVLAGVAMAGTALLGTQFLQSVLDLSPTTAALWFAPMGLGVGWARSWHRRWAGGCRWPPRSRSGWPARCWAVC